MERMKIFIVEILLLLALVGFVAGLKISDRVETKECERFCIDDDMEYKYFIPSQQCWCLREGIGGYRAW